MSINSKLPGMQLILALLVICWCSKLASCKPTKSACARSTPVQVGESLYSAFANPRTMKMLTNNTSAVTEMKDCIALWVGKIGKSVSDEQTRRFFARSFAGNMLQYAFLSQLNQIGSKIQSGSKFDVSCFSVAIESGMSWNTQVKDWRTATMYWKPEMVKYASQNCKDVMESCLKANEDLLHSACIDPSNVCITAAVNEKKSACAAAESAATSVTVALYLLRVLRTME